MTLHEKIGQLTQLTLETLCVGAPTDLQRPLELDPVKVRTVLVEHHVGSILNVGTHAHPVTKWRALIGELHRVTREETTHGVPLLYGIDTIHGANYVAGATLFPQQLGLAATFSRDRCEELAALAAYETRAAGIPWNFSPCLDAGRQPLWPRLWEGFGEDTYLSSELGEAYVRGYQGDDPADPYRVAACLKHFVGYGAPLSGKDRTPAWIPERQLRELYLPAFRAAIDRGAMSIMINSGEVNGVPAHASKFLLTTVLREELGFEGVVVTDWLDIQYLHNRHYVAETPKEAVRMAVEAGIDMSMVPYDFTFGELLHELVEEGTIAESRIDESVARVLRMKQRLGLYETTVHPVANYPEFGSELHRARAQRGAVESFVLLKNTEALLPIAENTRLLITGPTADSMQALNGGWTHTWQGTETDAALAHKPTVLRSILERVGPERVEYEPGCTFSADVNTADTLALARTGAVDVVLCCLGEDAYCEQFGNIHDLQLPLVQRALLRGLVDTGKPVILLLLEGRPRVIGPAYDGVGAALLGLLPGSEGAPALVELLYGDISPSGKLPISYPKHPNSLVSYDHKKAAGQALNGFADFYAPLYPFGHGLSYTTFRYSRLEAEPVPDRPQPHYRVSVEVTNTGQRQADESVLLFLTDEVASITPANRKLRGFERITLRPDETQRVHFELDRRAFAFVGLDMTWIVEPGTFTLRAGDQQKRLEWSEKEQ